MFLKLSTLPPWVCVLIGGQASCLVAKWRRRGAVVAILITVEFPQVLASYYYLVDNDICQLILS